MNIEIVEDMVVAKIFDSEDVWRTKDYEPNDILGVMCDKDDEDALALTDYVSYVAVNKATMPDCLWQGYVIDIEKK